MTIGSQNFEEVWVVDFEFSAPAGELPRPVCMVAWEIATRRKLRFWQDDLLRSKRPPYSIGQDSLFVAYYASAEIGCHLALGWPMPTNVLDLFVEFRNLTNGLSPPSGSGLLGALIWFGVDTMGAIEKESMRQLAIRGGPWTQSEKKSLLQYCESDVEALARLFSQMLPNIDLRRALFRGRYMRAAAHIENVGVPIDVPSLVKLRDKWDGVKGELIERIDAQYHVYDNGRFGAERWADYLAPRGIPWPRLESGALALDDGTFREMARSYPEVAPFRELRYSLSQMRLEELAVGSDGRNRCLLSAFRALTGRNQPSNTKFIFGPSVWLRGLIQPKPGFGLAHIDWSQQEFGIAAALSGDSSMMHAYESGDPYLEFAKQAGAVPTHATKGSHASIREQFKACCLAVQYGMGARSLASRLGQSTAQAENLLQTHRSTYKTFWRWSDNAVDYAMLHTQIHTVFGWVLHLGPRANSRSLRNFPMQANGAEMLRLACCFATEQGIRVCAPIHDALLIEAPIDDLGVTVSRVTEVMARASELVLGGFRLRSEAKTLRFPARYQDERGRGMWTTVWDLVGDDSLARTCA